MSPYNLVIRVLLGAVLPWTVLAERADKYTFLTIDYPGADSTWGFTISSSGETGGQACTSVSCQGFLFVEGADPVLITPAGATNSYVTGIQRGGYLVSGHYEDAAGMSHGYVWNLLHPSEFTPIDPDPNGVLATEVADMNPSDDLAGYYVDLDEVGHGYVQRKGVLKTFDLPGASFTAAFGINPEGDVVGSYCDASACHAYLLRGGIGGVLTTIDVRGAVETDAFGINALGQIAGGYCLEDGNCHGYLREPDGSMIAVEPPGATGSTAFAVNPASQITGVFADVSGSVHAFLATPLNTGTGRAIVAGPPAASSPSTLPNHH